MDKTIRGWYKIFPLIPLSFLIITLGYISMPAVIEILFFYDAKLDSVLDILISIVMLISYSLILYMTAYVIIAPENHKQKFYRKTGMVEMPRDWFRGWIKGQTLIFPFTDDAITQS